MRYRELRTFLRLGGIVGATVAVTAMNLTLSVPAQAITGSPPVVLPAPPGFTDGGALAINDVGTVLGEVSVSNDPPFRAVRWDRLGRVTQLDLLPGSESSAAVAINNHDVAVGVVYSQEMYESVRWDRQGRATVLEPLPGSTSSVPRVMNDAGVVAGQAYVAGGVGHAVRWDAQGHVTDLGVLPGRVDSNVTAINDHNVVVGISCMDNGGCRAVRWDRDGRITDLGVLPGHEGSGAEGVNDRGMVIGGSWSGGYGTAVRWDADGVITVPAAPAPDLTDISLVDINDAGIVAGNVWRSDGTLLPARWDRRNHATLLDMLATWGSTFTVAVNDAGDIAGLAGTADGGTYAVRWGRDGRIAFVSTAMNGYGTVTGMNNAGVMVGHTYFADGHLYALLWRT